MGSGNDASSEVSTDSKTQEQQEDRQSLPALGLWRDGGAVHAQEPDRPAARSAACRQTKGKGKALAILAHRLGRAGISRVEDEPVLRSGALHGDPKLTMERTASASVQLGPASSCTSTSPRGPHRRAVRYGTPMILGQRDGTRSVENLLLLMGGASYVLGGPLRTLARCAWLCANLMATSPTTMLNLPVISYSSNACRLPSRRARGTSRPPRVPRPRSVSRACRSSG